ANSDRLVNRVRTAWRCRTAAQPGQASDWRSAAGCRCAFDVSILAVHLRPSGSGDEPHARRRIVWMCRYPDRPHDRRAPLAAAPALRRTVLLLVAVLALWPRLAAQEPSVRMITDEGEAAQQWARWRGPSGQGLAFGSGYPDTWSGTDNVLWKTAVPGNGNSSP